MEMKQSQKIAQKRACIVKHYYYDLLIRREAEALLNAGYCVDVVCMGSKVAGNKQAANGVRLHRLPLSRKKGGLVRYMFEYLSFFFLAAFKLAVLHFHQPFSFIQVNNMPDFLVFSTLFPRILGAKVTLMMYEPTPELWAAKYNIPLCISLLKFVEKVSLRYAHAVVTVTEQMRQVFIDRKCPPEKISVVLNVPDERFFDLGVQPRPKDPRFTLICHGAIEERYGHDTMLQAVALVKPKVHDIQLRILGRGSYLRKFLAQLREMHLEDHVFYLGFVSAEEMFAELEGADVGIVAQKSSPYSNLVHTGKLYDYIHFGLPVLASHLDSVEAYFGRDSLYFFKPGDAESLAQGILDLYQHPEKKHKMIENSKRLYSRYNWEQQKRIYLSVYRRLAG